MARKRRKDCVIDSSVRCVDCGDCCGFLQKGADGTDPVDDTGRCQHGVREDRQCPECRDGYSKRYLDD